MTLWTSTAPLSTTSTTQRYRIRYRQRSPMWGTPAGYAIERRGWFLWREIARHGSPDDAVEFLAELKRTETEE